MTRAAAVTLLALTYTLAGALLPPQQPPPAPTQLVIVEHP